MSSFLGHSLAAYSLFSLDQRQWANRRWRAMWLGWLLMLASAPDIDYLVPALSRHAHRGSRITHSIAFSLMLPLFSVGLLYFLKGLGSHRKFLSICAVLAGLSHLVLDFLVGVTPLPLLWPLSSAAFYLPVGILPSAGRIQLSNYYFYRNLLIEVGILVPLLYLGRESYLEGIGTRNKAATLILVLVAGCFLAWSVSLSR